MSSFIRNIIKNNQYHKSIIFLDNFSPENELDKRTAMLNILFWGPPMVQYLYPKIELFNCIAFRIV